MYDSRANKALCCAVLISLIALICVATALISSQPVHAAPTYRVLHTFNSHSDGFSPYYEQLLLGVDGNYYGTTRYGGTNNNGTVFMLTSQGELTTLFSFTSNSIGQNPQGRLAQDSNGTIYGTTEYGGANSLGVIYRIKPDGSGFTTLYSFGGGMGDAAFPASGVILSGSILYGTLLDGGAHGNGAIYKFATGGTTDTLLHSFAGSTDGYGAYFAPILSGSTLYGCCSSDGPNGGGTLFSQTTDGATFSVLHAFSMSNTAYGYSPNDVVRGTGGVLYGNSAAGGIHGNGALWSYALTNRRIAGVYSFTNGIDGNTPNGYLQVSGTMLYGVTGGGGVDADNQQALGIVYSFSLQNMVEKTLHAFLSDGFEGNGENPGVLLSANGASLIGIRNAGSVDSYGTVWDAPTSGSGFKVLFAFGDGLHDASTPYAGLVEGPDGRLHGTTYYSYNSGNGTVYSIGLGGVDYSIDDIASGHIYAPVTIDSQGDLFGVTYDGGIDREGSLFEAPAGSDYEDLFSFDPDSGDDTGAPLFLAKDGNFYSTTAHGGQDSAGTIFRYDPATAQETVLYSFSGGNDGGTPQGGVIQASDGNFYGTTTAGGADSDGTVFRFTPGTSRLNTLHSFTGSDGANPDAGVIESTSGALYGTTYNGGAHSNGALYRIDKTGSGFKLIYSFGAKPSGDDGTNPQAGVTQFSNGRLYGTASNDGTHGGGVVYSILTTGAGYQVLHDFGGNGIDGSNPVSAPVEGSDGNVYGECVNSGISPFPGTNISGTIWEIANP